MELIYLFFNYIYSNRGRLRRSPKDSGCVNEVALVMLCLFFHEFKGSKLIVFPLFFLLSPPVTFLCDFLSHSHLCLLFLHVSLVSACAQRDVFLSETTVTSGSDRADL